jgi:hypothetical protein
VRSVLAVKTRTALAATFGNMARRERTQPAGGVPAHRLDADTSVNRIGYGAMQLASPGVWGGPGDLCVPTTSFTSCDQPIFVDHATDVSVFSDAVQVEIDWLG